MEGPRAGQGVRGWSRVVGGPGALQAPCGGQVTHTEGDLRVGKSSAFVLRALGNQEK